MYLTDLIYPRECRVCGNILCSDEKYLCPDCAGDMPLTYFWGWRGNPAEERVPGPPYFEKAASLYFYSRDNGYRHIVQDIKYGYQFRMGIFFGEMLGKYMKEYFGDTDIIIPVTVQPIKLWTRGYNQAEMIARGIASGLGGIPVDTKTLFRIKYRRSQTALSMAEKPRNVKDAFRVSESRAAKGMFAGKHLLLVDDVLTSGATATACREALSALGDIRVSLATLAFVRS